MNQNETIIEFKAVKGEDEIAGYMYLEDADDEDALHFYDQQGLESGFYVPKNPYKMNTPEWNNYEKLSYEFQSDDMVIQFLVDFATKNKTIQRDGYSLIINKGYEIENKGD